MRPREKKHVITMTNHWIVRMNAYFVSGDDCLKFEIIFSLIFIKNAMLISASFSKAGETNDYFIDEIHDILKIHSFYTLSLKTLLYLALKECCFNIALHKIMLYIDKKQRGLLNIFDN